jgi:hypothetical protein
MDLSRRHDYKLSGRRREGGAGTRQVAGPREGRRKIKFIVPVARIFNGDL